MDLPPDHRETPRPADDPPRPRSTDHRAAGPRGVFQRLGVWLQATPAELVGLVVLLAGAVAVTAVVFWDAGQRPSAIPPAATVGDPAAHDDHGSDPGSPTDPTGDATGGQDVEVVTTVTVHVSGAVGSTGLVTLGPGARVADAIEAAGGATAEAELDRLNLARLLLDGEQVHVPRPGEVAGDGAQPGGTVADGGGGGVTPDGRIDLNRASQDDLETLPGIGPAKAAAIVTHREMEGAFSVPGDLRAVPGIGEQTFQRLADLITVG